MQKRGVGMNSTKLVAGAILSLLMTAPSFAAGTGGWYVSGEGGGVWVNEWDHLRTRITRCGPEITQATASFSTGWAALGAIGYGLHNWRVEAEGGYRSNDLDSYVKHGWTINDASGKLTQATAMLNVIYDVPLSEMISFSLGAGAGGDFTSTEIDLPWSSFSHDQWNFAYQGIAGVNYALSSSLGVFLDYRYMNARGGNFEANPVLLIDGENLQKHTATLGVRYAFAPPLVAPPIAPPAPPQPAAPVEREFLIFFGFNKSELTPQAMATVRQAAVTAQQQGTARIRVVGHTDRSGSLSYNRALSMHRAERVKSALVGEGVTGPSISISGRGESEPLVATADGVRESQNRRVKITF